MNVEAILGSRARVRILRALYDRDGASGRNLSARAGVSPSSGKAALEDLMEAGLVLVTHEGGRHCYEINRSHVMAEPLEQLFAVERKYLQKVASRLEPLLTAARVGPLRALCVEDGRRISLLVSQPVGPESGLRQRMQRLLWYTFGLRLRSVFHEPAEFPAAGEVWVAPAAFENLKDHERRRFLRFFNLKRRKGR